MENTNINKTSTKERGCRRFFYRAVSVTTPTGGFKPMRCPFQQKDNNSAAARNQQSATVGQVPIIFESSSSPPRNKQQEKQHVKFAQVKENDNKIIGGSKAEVVASIHQKPSRPGILPHAFTAYIDRAGAKIRTSSSVYGSSDGAGKKKDTFNKKVADYITRTRHKFHAPSHAASADTTTTKYRAAYRG